MRDHEAVLNVSTHCVDVSTHCVDVSTRGCAVRGLSGWFVGPSLRETNKVQWFGISLRLDAFPAISFRSVLG